MHLLWICWYWKGVLLLWCPLFLYWHCLENRQVFHLSQVVSCKVSHFWVCNCKQFGLRWHPFSYLFVFWHVQEKIWCLSPLPCLLPLVTVVPTHWNFFNPMYFCVYQYWLGVYIQVNPLFHHQLLSFTEYWDTDGISYTLVFSGIGTQWALYPYNCTLSYHFYVWWGICAPVKGWALSVPLPPLVMNTPFLHMWCGLGVWVFFI